jgi:hypothetical protein
LFFSFAADTRPRSRNARSALPPGTVNGLIWFSPDENFHSRSAEVDATMMRGNNGIVNKMEF